MIRSAEQGVTPAQHYLGQMYETGNGVIRDQNKAAEWYQRAAESGYAPSADNLGYLYTTGQGVRRDYQLAIKWFSVAADQGYKDALNNLAWTLATVPVKELRDGKRAISIIENLLQSEENEVGLLDTLAAGYAELGVFDKAIKVQKKAIDHLQSTHQEDRLEVFMKRLKTYQAGKPWRMPIE
jgi:TPR repeat protein